MGVASDIPTQSMRMSALQVMKLLVLTKKDTESQPKGEFNWNAV